MTGYLAIFDTTRLERHYSASIAQVFAALSTREAVRVWASPGKTVALEIEPFEFRNHGVAVTRMEVAGSLPWISEDRYQEILPGRRIIQTSALRHDGKLCFAGVVVYEIEADGDGTLLRLTEQGVFPDGRDSAEMHHDGWSRVLDQLGEYLAGTV